MKRAIYWGVITFFTFFSSLTLSDVGGGYTPTITKETKPVPNQILAMVENEQYEPAIDKLSEFLKDEKKSADGWNLLGYSQRKVGRFDASLKSYKKALKYNKKHLGAHEYIGELYLQLDEVKKAKKHLKRLKKYCGDCEQYQALKEAITQYETTS